MGSMSLDLFKKIIDQAEGNVEFISLASRGEPLVCKEIISMLEYTKEKFLYLKINTNASMLNEEKCHAILSGGVKTVIFSADAADENLYSKLRVNGKLKQVIKNIEQFKKIRETQYPNNSIISRVSGVKFGKEQDFISMKNLWGGLVDQVAFVNYNPWENSYDKSPNNIEIPCSDLWRRMFVWWDGKTNPCDSDYKSLLSVGKFPDKTLSQLWLSDAYKKLREKHLQKKRGTVKPCSSCSLI
jgi:radical SAM protein with 4Fe4S-binding SPASM domain